MVKRWNRAAGAALCALSLAVSPALRGGEVEESDLGISEPLPAAKAPAVVAGPSAARGDAAIVAARAAEIARDLAEAERQFERYPTPEALTAALRPAYLANNRAAAAGEAKWFGDAFFAAGKLGPRPLTGNFREAMIRLDEYLKSLGVDLIVVRVPTRHEVAFPWFAQAGGQTVPAGVADPYVLRTELELLDAGIEYVDGLKYLHRRASEFPLSYFYSLPHEGHPAEGLSRILADEIARRLVRYRLPKSGEFQLTPERDGYRKINWPAGNPKFDPSSPVEFAALADATGARPRIGEGTASPILFTSDSYGAYPGQQVSASIPHYVAWRTGHLPDWMYRDGSSPGTSTFLRRKGRDFVAGRQAVVVIAHPGMLRGVTMLPEDELMEIAPERVRVAKVWNRDNWNTLETSPAVGASGAGGPFSVQSDGTLKWMPLAPGARNGDAGEIRLRPDGGVAAAGVIGVRLKFAGHSYLTCTLTGGEASPNETVEQQEMLSISERVSTLDIFVRNRCGGMLKLKLNSVSGSAQLTEISLLEVLPE